MTSLTNTAGEMKALSDEITDYLEKRWPVLPLCWPDDDGKCACGGGHEQAGKAPLLPDGYKGASLDRARVAGWWRRWPRANVGIDIARAGLVVVDADSDDAVDEVLELWAIAPETPWVETGKGRHWYFKAPDGAGGRYIRKGYSQAIDILAEGYVVAPPSRHRSGVTYRYGHIGPPTPLPRAASDHMVARTQASTVAGGSDDVTPYEGEDLPPGATAFAVEVWRGERWSKRPDGGNDRSRTMYFLACELVEGGMTDAGQIASILAAWDIRNDGKYHSRRDFGRRCMEDAGRALASTRPRQAARAVASSERNEVGATLPSTYDTLEAPDGYPLTQKGSARRLVAQAGGDIRYVEEERTWIVWKGTHWERDTDADELHRLLESVQQQMLKAHTVDWTTRRRLHSHVAQLDARSTISAVFELAQTQPDVAVRASALDQCSEQIVVEGGTIELRTGKLRASSKEDLITRVTRHLDGRGAFRLARYDPGAPLHQEFQRFLDRVQPDIDTQQYLQRVAGLALTGKTLDTVFIHLGSGANGKGTFLNTIKAAIGPDLSHTAPLDVLVGKQRQDAGAATPHLAALRGKRLAIASEPDANDTLAEGQLKALASEGETVTARQLYRDPVEFVPTASLHVHSNHRPRARGTDDGLWRRIHLVPWGVTIKEGERDDRLKERLQEPAVLVSVLAWMVKGAQDVLEGGLRPSKLVREATSAYRAESDVFGQWVDEQCILGSGKEARMPALCEDYRRWCEERGHHPLASNRMADRLRQLDGVVQHRTPTARLWMGIGLRQGAGVDEDQA